MRVHLRVLGSPSCSRLPSLAQRRHHARNGCDDWREHTLVYGYGDVGRKCAARAYVAECDTFRALRACLFETVMSEFDIKPLRHSPSSLLFHIERCR